MMFYPDDSHFGSFLHVFASYLESEGANMSYNLPVSSLLLCLSVLNMWPVSSHICKSN